MSDDPVSGSEAALISEIEAISEDTPYAEFFEFMAELMKRKNADEYEDVVDFVTQRLNERIENEAVSNLGSEL